MHRDEARFANEAFYIAFANHDLQSMERLWDPQADLVCVHPGWPPLTDRAAIMESWARILGNSEQPAIAVHALTPVPVSDAMLVVCYERMGDGAGGTDATVMVASNMFVDGVDGPRLVFHHSGLCGDPPQFPEPSVPTWNA